jgi:hypothetical protein
MKKNLFLLLSILLLFNLHESPDLQAQNNYQSAMSGAIAALKQAASQEDFLASSARFERIGLAEKERWLPWYYSAYALILPSFDEPDGKRKDQLLDRAQEAIDRALELAPGESEIHVLQAFLYPSRILVDPVNRGLIYMDKMQASLDRSRKLNPDNPRTYYLEGVQKLNLPAAFGGGPEVARPILETAMEKYAGFQTDDPLWPFWGEESTRKELEKLNNL